MELTLQEKLKLINFFEFLLNEEVSKASEEMNSEAVDNYIKILLHLQDKHVELSSEFIDEQVRKIFHPEETAAPETAKTTQKHYKKNKIWLVAACVAILVALFSIISFSSERSVKDILEDYLGTFKFISFDTELDIDKDSYGKEGTAKQYSTIEEIVKNENVDLLYPTNIANTIETVSVGNYNGKKDIRIVFSDPDLYITITLNSKLSKETIDFCNEKIILNGIECHLCIMEDLSKSQAYFIHDNNLYFVSHSNRDVLMEILENMEEITHEN